jgi:hypothetical protein
MKLAQRKIAATMSTPSTALTMRDAAASIERMMGCLGPSIKLGT